MRLHPLGSLRFSPHVAAPFARVAALTLGVGLAALACGGNSSNSAANAPNGGANPGAGDGNGTAGATALMDGGPSTTTTAGLDTGDGGTKLPNVGPTRGPDPGRSRDDIRGIILARREQARACYDAALPAHPGIEGDVNIKWTIDPKGNPTNLAVDSSRTTLMEPSVGQCLMTMIMSIKFSESPRGLETSTNYPFNFHPRGTPASTAPAGAASGSTGAGH